MQPAKNPIDKALDTILKANTIKFLASYMTSIGEVKGNLVISAYFLIFDPEFSSENKKIIHVLFIIK